MSDHLPPYLRQKVEGRHKICIIAEGYEEDQYIKRLRELNIFSNIYEIIPINAKGAGNVQARYHDAFASNDYEIVFVLCDRDRKPEQYVNIIKGIDKILGEGKYTHVTFFSSPCTLQIILSHFGNVQLLTQSKKKSKDIVKELTGVEDYDAHEQQVKDICRKVNRSNYNDMKDRVKNLSTSDKHIPASNILNLFSLLENDNSDWIIEINRKLDE